MRRNIIFLFLPLILPLFALGQGSIALDQQEAKFDDVTVLNGIKKNEIRGFEVEFTASFLYTARELKWEKSGLPSHSYRVQAYLLDPTQTPIPAVPDAGSYRTPEGFVTTQTAVTLAGKSHEVKNQKVFFPWFAPAMPAGKHDFRLRLDIMDHTGQRILASWVTAAEPLEKPKSGQVRVTMFEFEVDKLDYHNENWDYFFLNPMEARPDPKWKVIRGVSEVHSSERQKNEFVYRGSENDRSRWFTLSEGDKMYLQVNEHDVTTLSDVVGKRAMEPLASDFSSGQVLNLSFDKVIRMETQVDILRSSAIKIGVLNSSSEGKFRNMSGVFLSFNYEVERASGNAQFLGKVFLGKEREKWVRQIYGASENVEFMEDGQFLITGANKGTVRLFIPHFALIKNDAYLGTEAVLRIDINLEDRRYLAAHATTAIRQRRSPISDIRFERLELRKTFRDGVSGVAIDFKYLIPKGYFRGLPNSRIRIKPAFLLDAEPLPGGLASLMNLGGAILSGNDILAGYGTEVGEGSYFIPFYVLGLEEGNYAFTARFRSFLEMGETSTRIGSASHSERIECPELDSVRLYFNSLKIRKGIQEGSRTSWKVSLGTREIFTSISGEGKNKLFWPGNQIATVRAAPDDKVVIQVVNSGSLSGDKVLETWESTVGELQKRKGETLKLKSYLVKKLIGEVL